MVLTETWLNDEILSTQLFGNRYTVYRNDRNPASTGKKRGGGVVIAVSNRLSSTTSLVQVAKNIEQLWIKIDGGSRTICIGVVYLPPDVSTSVSCIDDHISSVLAVSEKLQPHDYHLLFGDYNQPGLSWKRSSSGHLFVDPTVTTFNAANTSLVDGMAVLNMKQMNSVTNSLNRTLDLVFVSDNASRQCDVFHTPDALVDADPYHPSIVTTLHCPSVTRFTDIPDVREFDFNKADFVGLNRALLLIDWSFLEEVDINAAVLLFNQKLLTLFRQYVPEPTTRRKPAWSNNRLRMLKRERAAALRAFTRDRNELNKQRFNIASCQYRSYNRYLYSCYIQRKQSQLKRNPKQFWTFFNEKRKENGLPSLMFLGDCSSNTSVNTCNLFAQQFASVYSNSTASPHETEASLRYVPENFCDINVSGFSEAEVESAMKQLKPSVAAGPDGIPSSVLKNCACSLSRPLKIIFNQSLAQGTFPNIWKKSYIFPVFKKGNKSDISNYRGITSLCAGSKLFEILIGETLQRSVSHYIATEQHGFQPGRSINTNLVEFTSFCLQHMEDGAQIDTVYTDIKAAFDRVDHSLLLAKLERLGASDNFVRWMESFLSNRLLSVKLGNTESRPFKSTSGVPQGSNLGPLLFSLFFNDVCLALPSGCKIVYADDLKVYVVVRSTADCEELQRLLNVFSSWCNCNRLDISVAKCSVISFNKKKSPIHYWYTMNCQPIQRETVVKDLGVLLDTGLSFQNHYSHIVSKANRNLGFLKRAANEFRDPYCLRTLYYSLVRSILETAAIVWSPYFDIWSSRIEAVQKKFVRFAFRFLPWTNPLELPPYESRCELLGMATLEKRRRDMRAVFIGKLLLGEINAPNILAQVNINVAPRDLRTRNFLRLSFHRTLYGQNEPIRVMCSNFNSVYHLFDFSVTCKTFKNRLRSVP